mmetsp:Transcript_14160/g.19520  ORF Transcript_14160/g.19520 Transcript_14160/m.19520 type:complete len:146 (+) Transcript_14160:461-898(+)
MEVGEFGNEGWETEFVTIGVGMEGNEVSKLDRVAEWEDVEGVEEGIASLPLVSQTSEERVEDCVERADNLEEVVVVERRDISFELEREFETREVEGAESVVEGGDGSESVEPRSSASHSSIARRILTLSSSFNSALLLSMLLEVE